MDTALSAARLDPYARAADLFDPQPTQDEVDRARYVADPVAWVTNVLGEELWSKQRAILESVRDTRRTAVPSCNASGKSFVAARLACWWITTHAPGEAFVVSTATTASQVKAILWKEIHRAHRKGKLPGRLNQTEWWMPVLDGDEDDEEIVAFGRKPSDTDPTAFQGIHAPYVLVIIDEAAGVPDILYEAADTLIVNTYSRILAIGNPEDADSQFARICNPGSGWNVIRIPAWETPNFTGEPTTQYVLDNLISKTWVEEKRHEWGTDHPFWKARVEAEFPDTTDGGLIPITWIRKAQERSLPKGEPIELGVDVGGGGDRSVIAVRHGPVVRVYSSDNNPNTMSTTGNVVAALEKLHAVRAKVDEVGIGKGVVDRGNEQGKPLVGVNVGVAARDKLHFANFRAEAYWGLRERFQNDEIDIDPNDDNLASQLVEIKYKRTSSGKIAIESKEEMRRRGRPSPDEADAVVLAFCDPPPKKKRRHRVGTWGRKRTHAAG